MQCLMPGVYSPPVPLPGMHTLSIHYMTILSCCRDLIILPNSQSSADRGLTDYFETEGKTMRNGTLLQNAAAHNGKAMWTGQ